MPQTGTWLGVPFDSEIFLQEWSMVPDPILDAFIGSGVVVASPMIAAQITHGNFFTIPYYNDLTGDPANYDGKTDVPLFPLTGTHQSGVVTGRTIGWYSPDFQGDLSGGDHFGNAVNRAATFWRRQRQKMLIGQTNALFNMNPALIVDDNPTIQAEKRANAQAFVDQHVWDTGEPMGVTEVGDLAQMSLGDNAARYNLVVTHSRIARAWARLNLLEFRRYTDIQGVERQSRIADMDGLTVVVDDDILPVGNKYTTYLFGTGTFLIASGALNISAEIDRVPGKDGGRDELYTRQRITMHPNGFKFKVPSSGWTESPTDPQLFNGANWELVYHQKAMPIAKLVTTETTV